MSPNHEGTFSAPRPLKGRSYFNRSLKNGVSITGWGVIRRDGTKWLKSQRCAETKQAKCSDEFKWESGDERYGDANDRVTELDVFILSSQLYRHSRWSFDNSFHFDIKKKRIFLSEIIYLTVMAFIMKMSIK